MGKFITILKMAACFLPALALGGSIAGMAYVCTESDKMKDNTYEEIRQEQTVQDLIEQETQSSETRYKAGEISFKDHHDYLDYLESEEFLKEVVETSSGFDTEGYLAKLKSAEKMGENANYVAIPLVITGLASIIWYVPFSSEGPLFWFFLAELIDEFNDYLDESKEKKSEKKMRKEMAEYKEEIE